ncbi:MAG: ABC transporter ATP-binding protein [Deltaproteobacteria bacterium]|nr:ABC transporter ATP-binding protein [Deltaproteobacteria bacterium]
MHTLIYLSRFMGTKKWMLPASLLISALSAATGMLPYIFIWLIIRKLMNKMSFASSSEFVTLGWSAAVVAVLGVLLYFISLSLSHLAAFRVETSMRSWAMRRIIQLPLGFFENNTIGKVRKIIDDNVGITHSFLAHGMPDLAGSLLTPFIALTFILIFDWKLGLACLVPIAISMGIMGGMMGKRGRHFMKKYMDAMEEMNTEAVEYVRGIPVVKVFQQTVFSFKNFHASICRYRDMVEHYTRMWEKPMSAYTIIIHGFAYFLIPAAIVMIGSGDDYSVTVLNTFLYILITPIFAQCIMRSMYLMQSAQQAKEAITRLEDLLTVPLLSGKSDTMVVDDYTVQFENVSFKYPGTKENALNGISFTIPEGNTFALVGLSGSGKSTIAKMVARFWDGDKGRVSIGGKDVKNINPHELMKHVSFVFQQNVLFKKSLYENIRYGRLDASEREILDAAKSARCDDIFARLPDGIHTSIGVDGTYLSGGEQQRIALARAVLKNAPIVVLDEATAFADPENEHLIRESLASLTKGKTVLLIAHRLSSVVNVDNILVVAGGKIVEQGTHTQLIERNETYARMWREYQQALSWTIVSSQKEMSHEKETAVQYA